MLLCGLVRGDQAWVQGRESDFRLAETAWNVLGSEGIDCVSSDVIEPKILKRKRGHCCRNLCYSMTPDALIILLLIR